MQQKYSKIANDKESYQKRAGEVIRQNLLEMAKMKRKERGKIIPEYGYFKDNTFIEGSSLKSLK